MIDVEVTVTKVDKKRDEDRSSLILSDASGKKMTIFSAALERALYIKEVIEGKKKPSDDVYGLIDPQFRRKLMKRMESGQKPVDVTIVYHVLSNEYSGTVGLKNSTERLGEYRASDLILIALRYKIPIRVPDHLLH